MIPAGLPLGVGRAPQLRDGEATALLGAQGLVVVVRPWLRARRVRDHTE
ncbi:hypothetical protein NKH18_45250 [Streptomyces sp. M10(2022)]